MKGAPARPARRPWQLPTTDEWKRSWQQHWRKVGMRGYELPPGEERDFLAVARTPARERDRLQRITAEFERAFRTFYEVGPAVTVFGSARFKETHPYYKLARAVGGEWAKAGFAVPTGRRPGIMETANRDAHETGGQSSGLTNLLPPDQCEHRFVDRSLGFHFSFTRKVCLVRHSCVFIVLPGGLGTMDQLLGAATSRAAERSREDHLAERLEHRC